MNSKKLILSICDISPSKMGSFEEFLVNLTQQLKDNSIDHMIIFRETPIPIVEKALIDKGAILEIIKPSRSYIYNFYVFYFLVKRVKPDIIHFHFYPTYTILNYLKFITGVPIIYTDHMGVRISNSKFKKLVRKIYYHINYLLFDVGIDRIICVSDFVKQKFLNDYGIRSDKLYVIYNGINVRKFNSTHNTEQIKQKYNIKDEYVVSCVGLRADKGPHFLLEAAPFVLKKIPNALFLFVGEDDCKRDLEQMATTLGIGDRVVFTGKIIDMSYLYAISSIVVIPSVVEEAFCFVGAESMAAKVPIIAFDSGAIKTVLYDHNYIIPADSIQLSNKIIECIEIGTDVESAREHVMQKFSVEASVAKHILLYNDYLKQS